MKRKAVNIFFAGVISLSVFAGAIAMLSSAPAAEDLEHVQKSNQDQIGSAPIPIADNPISAPNPRPAPQPLPGGGRGTNGNSWGG